MTLPSKQMSKADVLLFTIETLAQKDSSLSAKAGELERAQSKGGHALDAVVTRLGADIQEAIRALPMDRCDLLTMPEVTALMGTSERNAERYVSDYLDTHRKGDRPGHLDYHPRTQRGRKYWKWFYHLKPFDAFLEGLDDREYENRRAAGLRQRHTPAGIAKRQIKAEAEMRELGMVQAVLKKDRLDLVRTTLADHPLGPQAQGELAALRKTLAAMGVSLEDMVALQTFVQAQMADITTSVVVRQPWLVDAQGRVTDHAWWAIDADAESIRADLVAGGTVVHMPLVEALEREWRSGNAYAVWSAIADMAAVRSIESRKRHLAAMRQAQDEGNGKDLPVKERTRSS